VPGKKNEKEKKEVPKTGVFGEKSRDRGGWGPGRERKRGTDLMFLGRKGKGLGEKTQKGGSSQWGRGKFRRLNKRILGKIKARDASRSEKSFLPKGKGPCYKQRPRWGGGDKQEKK